MPTGNTNRRKRSLLRSFLFLLEEDRLEFAMVVIASSMLCGIEGVLHPLLTKAIFDQAASRGNFHQFVGLILGYLALGLFANISGYGVSLWQLALENKIVRRISRDMLRAYYQKDYRDILREGHGYYITRIRGDVKEGVVPMLALVRLMANQLTRLIALTSVLIFISWKAFLILCAIIPVSSIVSTVVGKKIREFTSLERDQEAGVVSSLSKSLSAFKVIKNFSLLPRTLTSFDAGMENVLSSGYKKYRVMRMLQGAGDLTMVVSDFCSLFVGALFVFRHEMTFGAYLAFMNSFWRSATTLMDMFSQSADLHGYGVTMQRVVEFLTSSSAAPYYLPGPRLSVTKVAYSYGGSDVLAGFSIDLAHGERVLIVGPNGSGKTTLANILSGYLAPSRGEVVLPDRISSITLPIAFPAIKVAELGADPKLLDLFSLQSEELLESEADELSAGQQQKLALALALSKEADLYIMGEPLANLDVQSKSVAIREIFERTRHKTLVMIMHGGEEYHSLFDRVVELGLSSDAQITFGIKNDGVDLVSTAL